MIRYQAGSYDVAVVGAGHAGCEAALAAARLGVSVALFTMSLDQVANLPCNPSIGGTAKGHIVREIDALGGEMGRIADKTFLQSRMLNIGKGPAVHSLRVQSDRQRYHEAMKETLEGTTGLDLVQAEIVDLTVEEGRVREVISETGARYAAKTVILCTGTYLAGRVHIGEYRRDSGPDGAHASMRLSERLRELGAPMRRFKTGTPARVHRDSIDFTLLEVQEGDREIVPFSFDTDETTLRNKVVCHIAYTNEETHRVIRENLGRSPLFSGAIEGTGPRYCPSIEDKVVRFPEKKRHQLFIEPMGEHTAELYLQGMSSSLPQEVQEKFYRTIRGLEQVKIMRNAYAIEYDCIDPLALRATLELKEIGGLFGAGQFNGTSGYEEAAAQGLVAGINAANQVLGRERFILGRQESYIGTLIDDLVTKGTDEPYRMMTSRSEYRLLLRQDNAERRLMPRGRELGLIGDERWERFLRMKEEIETEIKRLEKNGVAPSDALNRMLSQKGTAPISAGTRLADLLRRPQIGYGDLAPFDEKRPPLSKRVAAQVETEIKYEGYITKQLAQAKEMERYRRMSLSGLDYEGITGLRLEAREKLMRIQPESLGQAMEISGVNPADLSVLMLHLSQKNRREGGEDR